MASSPEILRQYLVSLGYQVDLTQQRRFDLSLFKTEGGALSLTKRLLGVAAASQAAMVAYARSMERMYYSSKRAESSVSTLQAFGFAGENVGVGAEAMTSAIEGLARSLRSNPGLTALLEALGVKTQGRERAEILMDLVEKLKGMPLYIGQQYASMFGMDADTFFMLSEGLEKFKEMAALQRSMAKDMGLNADTSAEVLTRYSQKLKEITERLKLLGLTVATESLPVFEWLAKTINESLSNAGKLLGQVIKAGNETPGGILEKSGAQYKAWAKGFWRGIFSGNWSPSSKDDRKSSGRVYSPGGSDLDAVMGDPDAFLNLLETSMGLPKGVLDGMWLKESGRGKNKGPSKAGAAGDFQFMPGTADQYGVDTNDFYSSAKGAARYMSDLLKKYGGDLQKALAAYNWGPGNLDKYLAGTPGMTLPQETRNYVEGISGRPIQIDQKTYITVPGTADPAATGRAVAREQAGVANETVRNLRSAVQ